MAPEETEGYVYFGELLGEIQPDTQICCCGPERLLKAVEAASAHLPPGSLHNERFVAKEFDTRADVPFEMEYVDSGVTLTIPVGKSNQEVVEAEGLSVISSCGEGTCRTCETVVVAGEVERRDSILTDEEKAACDSMFICVSLSKDDCSLKLSIW